MKRKKYLQLAFAVTLLLVAAVSVAGMLAAEDRPQLWQGEVESPQVVISGRLSGRVDSLYVAEGQRVRRGDTLLTLRAPEARAKERQAEAMERAAMYQRERVDAGTRVELLRSAEEGWRKAQSDLRLAEVTFARIRSLYADSVVTLQRFDEVHTAYEAALAAERVAHQQYELARAGAAPEDREAALSLQQAAEAATQEVEALLEDAVLTAPADGEVSVIYPRRGELVGAGMPLVTLLVTADTYVVMNVREDHLPAFPLGSTFQGRVPALGDSVFRFRIYYLSPLGSYATWRSIRLSGGYDMKTFELRARVVDEEKVRGRALRPGMSVLVERRP